MKNFLKIALLSTTLISSLANATENKTKPVVKLNDSSIVAEFNNTKVTLKEVVDQFKEMLENQPGMKGRKFWELDKNVQENMVKNYVNSKLIAEEARQAKTEESKEFKEKLENIKSQLAQQIFIENLIKEKVTDADIKAEYAVVKKDLSGKEEIKTRHILVEKEETAKEVKDKLNKGANFVDLAKEYSLDEGSKFNGGELGFFAKGQLVPEFENAAFALKKDEVSSPIKSQFGWHIIKLEDRKPVTVPSLEEAKSSIKNKLGREAFEQYIATIDKKAQVKINLN